jgi:hypothetical protein
VQEGVGVGVWVSVGVGVTVGVGVGVGVFGAAMTADVLAPKPFIRKARSTSRVVKATTAPTGHIAGSSRRYKLALPSRT